MPRRKRSSAFHRVLVGCDGSPEASDAVALGSALATLCDAGLTVAGVYPFPLFPMPEAWSGAARERETEAILRCERDPRASKPRPRPLASAGGHEKGSRR
jgi:hypothetical protein